MSLFENDMYQWRETYFVLFNQENRPDANALKRTFKKLGSKYQLENLKADEEGRLESATLLSPDDYAAMDIVYVSGEEVKEQLVELSEAISASTLNSEEMNKLKHLMSCDARFDVYHFEQVVFDAPKDEDEEFLDPGALLIVLDRLAGTCDGVSVDPQSNSFL